MILVRKYDQKVLYNCILKIMKTSYSMYVFKYFENIGFEILSRKVESEPKRNSDNFLLMSLDLQHNNNISAK